MEKVKQLIPRLAILLAGAFVGVVIQQSCSQQVAIGSEFKDDEFIENLSNYE
jgi:hypothetical protein